MPTTPTGDKSVVRTALFAGGVLAAVAVVYVGLATGGTDQVPANTVVLGFDVGGQSEQDAQAALSSHFAKISSTPMTLSVAGHTAVVNPADLGLALDPKATVAGVTGSQWNPLALAHRFTGSTTVVPVVTVDQAKLESVVAGLASTVDKSPTDASISITDQQAELVKGSTGAQVDQAAAANTVVKAFLTSRRPIKLPIITVQPIVTDAQAQQVLQTVAEPALAAPVAVTLAGKTATVDQAQIASVLSFQPSESTLIPVINGEKLHAFVAPAFKGIERPGRDATFVINRKNKPAVVPSAAGSEINPVTLADTFAGALTKTGKSRTVAATLESSAPKVTTAEAKSLGIRTRLATYTQHFPPAAYRTQNIGTAAKRVNGTLLRPGDVFSMNDTILERTVGNGYTKGFVVGEGGVLKMDEGGGVSTATTAVYNAAWFSGLEFVQHRAHSIYISRYEPGREATVSWGDFDMKFRNDSPNGVFITTKMADDGITVSMWGTKRYTKVDSVFHKRKTLAKYPTVYAGGADCHAQAGQDSFSIVVDRTFYVGNKLVKTEPITTTYKPSPHVICGSNPDRGSSSSSGSGAGSGAGSGSGSSSSPTPKPSST